MIRCTDPRQARAAQAQLADAGFEAIAAPGAYRPAPNGEDIGIIADANATIAAAARASQAPPLGLLAALPHASPPRQGGGSGFSGAITLDAPPTLLRAQIRTAIRLAVMEDEHARRSANALALSLTLPKAPAQRSLKALYIGAPSAFYLELERVFAAQGGVVSAAFSSFTGFDHLHDEVFDAVILNGETDPQKALAHCAALRRNTSFYHLPTMVLTAAGDAASADAAIERGASAIAALHEPLGPNVGWLFEAIRGERRRRSAEHGLRALRDVMGEPRTGLFQRAAFDAHLSRLAQDHHASGRPLSLIALRIAPAFGASQPDLATWRRGFGEIASLAVRLMREADSGAAIAGDLIALALPCSDTAAARKTAERIASVAECTAFAAGDNSAGPLVFERSVVELQPGESGAGLLARACRAIDVDALSA